MRRGVFGFALAATAAGLAFLFVHSHPVNPDAYHRIDAQLRSLQTLEARIGQQVLGARSGLLPHYDALVAEASILANARAAIPEAPRWLADQERAAFSDHWNAYVEAAAQKAALAEQFKTLHAAIRGSRLYFPRAAEALIVELAREGLTEEVSRVRFHQVSILRAMAIDREHEASEASDVLAKFEAAARASKQPAAWEPALVHARNVLRRSPEFDRVTRDVLGIPTLEHLETLHAIHQNGSSNAERRASVYRAALYLVSALVLVAATTFLRRLRLARRGLIELNADLERRVRNRTAELEKASERAERHAGELVRLNEQLEISYRTLDDSRREQLEIRDKFLSHVSHELRTPLAAIHQFVSLCLDDVGGKIRGDQREFLEVAFRNVEQLKRMISDLMDATRARSGKLRLEVRPLHLVGIVEDVVGTLAATAGAGSVALRARAPQTIPPVLADAARVRQVLNNLIENAVKFTPEEGQVDVSVTLQDEEMARVSVADTGCGIEAAHLERIFESLHQASMAELHSRKGLGLGLAICKELIERQGGTIWVESRVGEGTTFHFTVPVFALDATLRSAIVEEERLRPDCALLCVEVAATNADSSLLESARRTVRHLLKNAIYDDDVLLPRLSWSADRETYWLLAATDEVGARAIAARVERRLGAEDALEKLDLTVSWQAVDLLAGSDKASDPAVIDGAVTRLCKLVTSGTSEEGGKPT